MSEPMDAGDRNAVEAKMVQDHISVGASMNGESNVPVRLHTLMVRRPGRVEAALAFVDKCLSVVGFGAVGDGDTRSRGVSQAEAEYEPGVPCREFLETRAAALRTMTSYFNGLIDDELVVQATFKVKGEAVDVRFCGPIDGETGVVRDPRFAPQDGDPAPKEAVAKGDERQPVLVALPRGVTPDHIADIEQAGPGLIRLRLKTGNVLIVEKASGRIVG